jgi:hypothetical protein
MNGYTKLFSSIITSTIWTEDDKTRLVWITMLALADRNGEVQGSIPGLARLAGVSTEATEIAIGKFLSPDKHSRTKDDEGRRIEEIDGGWHLLNHAKYREMASRDESKSANAERQKRFRERQKRNADNNGEITESNGTVTHPLHIAESESESESESECTPNGVHGEQVASEQKKEQLILIPPDSEPKSDQDQEASFKSFYALYPKKIAVGKARQSWMKQKPPLDQVIKALEWQCESPDWIKDNGKWIPMPSTWLNQQRWLDEETESGEQSWNPTGI